MARDFAKDFYNSPAWRKCRKSFIAVRMSIDGGMCQDCRERPGQIVHHIVELTPDNIDNADIALGHDNLKYVCLECHNIVEHGYGARLPERMVKYCFGPDGEPVPCPPM